MKLSPSFLELLERFKFIDGDDYRKAVQEIAAYITENLDLEPESTAIAAREYSKYTDSSHRIVYDLKAFGGLNYEWTTNCFVSGLKEIGTSKVRDVVLVDEFLGSGESMSKSVAYVREEGLKNGQDFKIHCALIAAMDIGLDQVKKVADNAFAVHVLSRGITDSYSESEAAEKIALMTRLEDSLHAKSIRGPLKRHRLGYKKSEALYARHEGNTPNNVFPVFWWEKNAKGDDRDRLLDCR